MKEKKILNIINIISLVVNPISMGVPKTKKNYGASGDLHLAAAKIWFTIIVGAQALNFQSSKNFFKKTLLHKKVQHLKNL